MTKEKAIELVTRQNGQAGIGPEDMLSWTWLRLILTDISDKEWERATVSALKSLSR